MTSPSPQPLRIGVLTVSDTRSLGEGLDASGQAIKDWCVDQGHVLVVSEVVSDQTEAIIPVLLRWADGGDVDVVLTTGGTGFGPRDVTPEATGAVLERRAPGLSEAIRRRGEVETPYAPLSRGLAGFRGNVFLANLPGSPGGVRDGLQVLAPLVHHMVGLLKGSNTPHRQS